jgi:hypothetical protein
MDNPSFSLNCNFVTLLGVLFFLCPYFWHGHAIDIFCALTPLTNTLLQHLRNQTISNCIRCRFFQPFSNISYPLELRIFFYIFINISAILFKNFIYTGATNIFIIFIFYVFINISSVLSKNFISTGATNIFYIFINILSILFKNFISTGATNISYICYVFINISSVLFKNFIYTGATIVSYMFLFFIFLLIFFSVFSKNFICTGATNIFYNFIFILVFFQYF